MSKHSLETTVSYCRQGLAVSGNKYCDLKMYLQVFSLTRIE